MFFILSKLLTFLISPFVWILFFILISLISKNAKRKRLSLLIAILFFIFFSNGFILNTVKSSIEIKPIKSDNIIKKYNYGIVLGGGASFDEKYNRVVFHEASDRLFQAIELYKTGKIEKIFYSGGSGTITKREHKESDFVKDYLIKIGISNQDIEIENQSKNTHENAVFTAKTLKNRNLNLLLITSSLHAYRAKKCFENEGLSIDIYTTNYNSTLYFSDYILPNSSILADWNEFLHEIVGIITYRVSGYI